MLFRDAAAVIFTDVTPIRNTQQRIMCFVRFTLHKITIVGRNQRHVMRIRHINQRIFNRLFGAPTMALQFNI